MCKHIFICLFVCRVLASAQATDSLNSITNSPDFVPVAKFSAREKAMVAREMKAASSDFAAACINLARDVQDMHLTVYSVVSTNKARTTNEAGFKIQVIYHPELAENYQDNLGSYQRHYNNCLLDFALAQYVEGKKALGLRLVRMLAEAEPQLCWSSSQIQPTSIKKILASVEVNDGSLAGIFEQAVRDWHWRESTYKP